MRQPLSSAPIMREARAEVNCRLGCVAAALRIASRRRALGRLRAQSVQRPALGCQRLNRT